MKRALLLLAALATWAPASAQRIAPERVDMQWGRCLLVVSGQTRIDGGCYYRIEQGGDFHITGPRQVFAGIDYDNPRNLHTYEMSRDYWANVFRTDDGWMGYGNEDVRSTHGEGPSWTDLRREGACLVNEEVRVCVWRD